MKPVVLLLVLFVAVGAGAEDRTTAAQTQTAQIGGVNVSVTPLNLTERGAATADFQVALNTHMGALPGMLSSASLIWEGGREVHAMTWSGGRGGHHLLGKLSFPAAGGEKNGAFTLVLKRLDGKNDARFEWKVPLKSANNTAGG